MKFLNELLGFAVLTGPLWLILVVLAIAIWIAAKAAKRFERRSAKIAVGLLVFLLIFFVPFGDEVAGRMYLSHLCATEAGVKVYKTIELPAEYWDEQGRAKFYDEKNGNFYLSKEYPTELKIERNYSIFHIDRLATLLRDQKKEQLFSERVSYMYWGGWMRRNLSPHNSATSCSNDLERYGNFIRQVFKPASTK